MICFSHHRAAIEKINAALGSDDIMLTPTVAAISRRVILDGYQTAAEQLPTNVSYDRESSAREVILMDDETVIAYAANILRDESSGVGIDHWYFIRSMSFFPTLPADTNN